MHDEKINEWIVIAGAAALTALLSLEGMFLYGAVTGSGLDRPSLVTASATMAKAIYRRAR